MACRIHNGDCFRWTCGRADSTGESRVERDSSALHAEGTTILNAASLDVWGYGSDDKLPMPLPVNPDGLIDWGAPYAPQWLPLAVDPSLLAPRRRATSAERTMSVTASALPPQYWTLDRTRYRVTRTVAVDSRGRVRQDRVLPPQYGEPSTKPRQTAARRERKRQDARQRREAQTLRRREIALARQAKIDAAREQRRRLGNVNVHT